ncbi:TetR/AcrR family transcriptional regulator C-terminal domain-containing protein [Nocardia aurantia]|uniref:Tetracycline repressor protein class E n=1 Tax=Nocardia aurantia TaxID=2585199 RepID=A0A7K0DRP7_9NOCA|nr:TetR/AcrR family transcriptional regulator C-terminal domain-containing protein [Nocardia aurantia]MQY28396.1 Tetracycline repressor protein class E [Nocardia aurantia]
MAKRTRAGRAGLSRAQVLDGALDFIDREGVAALSMRRLGAELGVEAMTLYHYLPNKDALLDGLVERVMARAVPDGIASGPWEIALAQFAAALRATLLRHPGVVPLVATRPAVTPETLRVVEQGLKLLCDAGFALGRALDTLNTLTLFVIGHVASEVSTTPLNEAGATGSQTHIAELDDTEFPLLSAAARTSAGTDDTTRFEFGIAALLRGIAAAPA